MPPAWRGGTIQRGLIAYRSPGITPGAGMRDSDFAVAVALYAMGATGVVWAAFPQHGGELAHAASKPVMEPEVCCLVVLRAPAEVRLGLGRDGDEVLQAVSGDAGHVGRRGELVPAGHRLAGLVADFHEGEVEGH